MNINQSLNDSLNSIWSSAQNYIQREIEKQKIIDFVSSTKFARALDDKSIRISRYAGNSWIDIRVYNVDYDTVIEHLAGPMHRKFGFLWILKADGNYKMLTLKTRYNFKNCCNIDLSIEITEGHQETCEFVKKIERVQTDEELEAQRIVHSYKIKCDGVYAAT